MNNPKSSNGEFRPDASSIEQEEQEIQAYEEHEKRKKRTLARLLDEKGKAEGYAIALRSEMGTTLNDSGKPVRVTSYLTTHTMRYLSQGANLRMGSEMPFMKNSIDENGRLRIDEGNAAQVAQRAPDWTRQPALTAYLAHNAHRKFGTILAVISPSWVDDATHENWGENQRALRSAFDFSPIDSTGQIGLLNIKDLNAYALDGQHRIMGIRGISEVLDGHLYIKKKDGSNTGKNITQKEFLTDLDTDASALNKVLEEKVAVEYIPAVIKGETREEATRRIRSIFVSINSYAKKPDKGENYLLDESDGYSIAARKVGLTHTLFRKDRAGARINWKNTGLPERSHYLTTLQALRNMVFVLTDENNKDRAEKWEPRFKGMVPLRPPEKEIDEAAEDLTRILDEAIKLPSFKAVMNGDDITAWRKFPDDGESSSSNKGHLLMRPIGQEVLVRAVGRLLDEGMDIKEIFSKLIRLDETGGFEAHKPENVWYQVTYNAERKRMITDKTKLAASLLVHLVRGSRNEERDELLNQVKVLRQRVDDEGKWMDFDGNWVDKNDVEPGLPPVIQ